MTDEERKAERATIWRLIREQHARLIESGEPIYEFHGREEEENATREINRLIVEFELKYDEAYDYTNP